MSLRPRRGAIESANPRVTRLTPSSPRPSPTSSSSRLRILLFAAPLLLGWYLVSVRNAGVSILKQPPSRYAVCSPATSKKPQIVTMDESDGGRSLRAECIVIGEGKIIGRGTREEVRREWGDLETTGRGVRIFWLSKDETVLPGLIDAHAHVLQQGEAANSVDLVGATSVAEVVERIAAFVAADPEVAKDRTKFVMGLGWDQTKFKETGGDFPTAAHLEHDPRLAGRPIYLKRIDVHALWVSPAVLVLLPPDLPEVVPGGQIVRDPTTGEPTGVFLDNAMDYINAVIPPWTSSSRLRFLLSTSRSMLAHGLTGVHDAALAPADVRFLRDLDKDGKLPVRIYGMVGCVPTNSWCGDEEGVETYEGERLTVRAAKIFTDGALGSWGAAMHEPYSDAPDKKGFLITEEPELRELMGNWVSKGFQLASHGIGDRANTVVLDIYESLLRNLTFTDGRDGTDIAEVRKTQERVRWRVEHAQIMTPEDIERMGRLGIIASFQPTHATSDMGYAEQRIGAERIKGAYAWRSLLESGAPFALGSDFPVELVNPFHGIYSAITRKWPNGDSPHGAEGWYPRERLTILEALRGFTTLAAYSSFSTSNQGMLRPSFPADFIVVQGDLLELGTERMDETAEERRTRERKLRETEVRTTVVGGRVMHGKGL